MTEQQHVQDGSSTNVSEQDQVGSSQATLTMPKPKQKIKYLTVNDSNWKVGEVISRAGKATGKYKHWWNVRNEDDTIECIDWKNNVKEWHVENHEEDNNPSESTQENEETVYFSVSQMEVDPVLIDEAKERELNNWKKNNVYEVLPFTGQKYVSTRWVFTEKFIDGKKAVKARLVARGFEEETTVQVDSPACSKEAL